MKARMVPELLVFDLDKSLDFYLNLIGFEIIYDRPEERFAFIKLGGDVEFMLD